MAIRRARLVLALSVCAVAACDEGSGSVGDFCATPGFVCSTTACYQSPKTPGCSFVAPSNGRCPLELPHCSDPKVSSAYCDPQKGVCGTMKMTHPDPCPAFCNQADVAVCWDTQLLPVCADKLECVAFVDCSPPDGGADMAEPPDMTVPVDGAADATTD
jgi:hypothetical protein